MALKIDLEILKKEWQAQNSLLPTQDMLWKLENFNNFIEKLLSPLARKIILRIHTDWTVKMAEIQRTLNVKTWQVSFTRFRALIGEEWDPATQDGYIWVDSPENLEPSDIP